ncbi:unnamed protein product [Bursaphelenchus okinawaensis]|uniref:C-type lectin domain-containing protein n=1 Tax=Bursaphelenchus okinawaensis TaxID=465554 RepID=A0A811K034_9BILA|nr:unnamed protein product [Bursaphelenchus okinawaensis]CAG9088628.1 unnamed protein product [Bursaphelenchus okinawaensis]
MPTKLIEIRGEYSGRQYYVMPQKDLIRNGWVACKTYNLEPAVILEERSDLLIYNYLTLTQWFPTNSFLSIGLYAKPDEEPQWMDGSSYNYTKVVNDPLNNTTSYYGMFINAPSLPAGSWMAVAENTEGLGHLCQYRYPEEKDEKILSL